ncbi:DUF6338 family protein [Williamsia herbipolensis]|uniref:DUF6338 family protein n=1 Tax=Williamsia herbipolensis TaxID=1603258 RepID=A0AAU4K3B1_9NOCA|nr:DUF6338 family protein [Williamsia herbipolensis]
MIPQSALQVAVFLVLVLPGFVFNATRRQLRGGPTPDEKDFSIRLVHGIGISVGFIGLYLVILGHELSKYMIEHDYARDQLVDHTRTVGIYFLALTLGIPVATAFLFQIRLSVKPFELFWEPIKSRTPSAWDKFAPVRAGCYVKIRRTDGSWVGGFLENGKGFVSTYPEPKDIFLSHEFKINPSGEFIGPVSNTAGVYVPLNGGETVSWQRGRPT